MNCRYCGTRLIPGAMFCGECGRSVAASGPAPEATPLLPSPSTGNAAVPESGRPPAAAATPAHTVTPRSSAHCPQCGSPMDADDIFCGECGFVARIVLAPATSENDTIAITADPEFLLAAREPEAASGPEPEAEPLTESEPASGTAVEPDAEPTPEPSLLDEPEPSPFLGERFVLQFSTGESVTVRGTGLIGRNPAMEPGEYVDDLVSILDEGKSVSKTHLEFGQEDGEFWVSDRYSTNGTVIRIAGSEPRRCEPEHRYRVGRGGRVEIGDEFFVVI
jgi:hypothetical protein